MLAVVTGLPGAAKTLYTLSKLIKLFKNRQVYIYNIQDIDHEFFGSLPLEEPEKWYELPDGAVIIMDEAQEVFPLRLAGSQVPEKCSRFEKHRHAGLDIFLITQDATLLDVHIRKLCNKHYHLRRLYGTESCTVFEYEKWQPKPEDMNTIKRAVASPTWFFDKSIYEHYKSAELHTVKRKIPFKLIILPFFMIAAVVVGWWAFSTMANLVSTDKEALLEGVDSIGGGGDSDIPGDGQKIDLRNPVEKWIAMRTPLIEGLPWTAPLFDDVREVKTWPKPHCFIHSMKNDSDLGICECYSQQITKIKNVNDFVCRQLATEGWFDNTLESKGRGGVQAPLAPTAALRPQRVGSRLPLRKENVAVYQGEVNSSYDPRPGRAIRSAKNRQSY